ncbi:hypothetical protein GH714_020018 [Hevea brasiliensis]|uniref:Pentatricopeptide repeat-containing protein n=1 Tax=Hevea brasiliensis TaxID=3981 RepID=A0A6A6MUT0_HEVBR|nr:hypothetical protein GH714_020018 [Hevea brasiliensis]
MAEGTYSPEWRKEITSMVLEAERRQEARLQDMVAKLRMLIAGLYRPNVEVEETRDKVRKIVLENMVKVAALHLEGKEVRFGNYAINDPIGKIQDLKQSNSLQDYLIPFDELYPKAWLLARAADPGGFFKKVNELSDIETNKELIGMFRKCGSTRDAHWVFDRMLKRDMGSWRLLADSGLVADNLSVVKATLRPFGNKHIHMLFQWVLVFKLTTE